MEIYNRDEPDRIIDALTPSEFEARYFSHVAHNEPIECRCGFFGARSELQHAVDLELMHPLNRKNPRCTPWSRNECHYTAFEHCPKCRRVLFADGNWYGR